MGRKKGPALYELIKSKNTTEPPPIEPIVESDHEEVDLDHNVLVPGSSIRISIGTIGVVVAVCIALIIISYTMGFRKGSAITSKDYEEETFRQISESFTDSEPTPLDSVVLTKETENIPRDTGPAGWGPILSDPREINSIYYTLMQTTKEGALQLATFCREKGLETYAISGNNTRFFRVVAFPGSTDRNSSTLKSVQSKIHEIGKEWTETKSGRSDLTDAYLSITQ
jgi:hypothetical protein